MPYGTPDQGARAHGIHVVHVPTDAKLSLEGGRMEGATSGWLVPDGDANDAYQAIIDALDAHPDLTVTATKDWNLTSSVTPTP
jgi:hypothetical protein